MAVYKVPQDVEAEDKLIGPFSFKQFVFILVAVGALFLCFLALRTNPVFVVLPLPFAIFFGILGLWPRRDQPVEVYLLALAHYWTKPRKRIWNIQGHKKKVKITAPKKDEKQYSDNLSKAQVKSRLKNLASTLDSRGWSSKNVSVQSGGGIDSTDRLVMPAMQQVPEQVLDIDEDADVLDLEHNPLNRTFQSLTQQKSTSAREEAIEHMKQAAQAPPEPKTEVKEEPYPEMKQSVVTPIPHNEPKPQPEPVKEEKAQPSTAILNLSRDNDKNIATLARQAEQAMRDDETINLH